MLQRFAVMGVLIALLGLGGCASVPMAPVEQDIALKEFQTPLEDLSGLYIYRDCFVGAALKKTVYLDSKAIGETANNVYFHALTSPGSHTISTESEFSDNLMTIEMEGGHNYFIEQYIKMGVFVGGANLRLVSEEVGKDAVGKCKLAKGF